MTFTDSLLARARRAVALGRKKVRGVRSAPAVAQKQSKPTPKPVPRTAILLVNGFDRRGRWGEFNEEEAKAYPWVDLCIQQIVRHSRSSSYEILAWDNTGIPEHRRLLRKNPKVRMFKPKEGTPELHHGASLDRLLRKVKRGTEFVITLDTDSFPIRDGWIENLTGRLTGDVELAGVWRDEMLPKKPAFVHPSCLAIRTETLLDLGVGFTIGDGADVAHNVTRAVEARGARISRLRRSNTWSPHFLMGAVYGDLIYHQGAGSRAPKFSAATDAEHDEKVRLTLRDAAFSCLDDLLDVLTGNADPETVPALVALRSGSSLQE